jgi:hypothetical protein
MRPFHELRYGSPDGSQRGMFFTSGQVPSSRSLHPAEKIRL